MESSEAVAALLSGVPEVARSLTRLSCWPSDSFAVAYDELARKGHLHHLLLHAQQPVQLLEHVLACGRGSTSGACTARLVAVVNAVAGRPAERSILTLMVEVERRARDGRPRHGQCLVEQLRIAGVADFARKLDASIASDMCYHELSVMQLLECLEHDGSSVSPDSSPGRLPSSAPSYVRRTILRELCRRCCSPDCPHLGGLSRVIIVEMLRYGCPDALDEPRYLSRRGDALPPSAVAILHAFLCGTPPSSWADTPPMLCDHNGGKLLQRFVRGVVACVSGSYQHGRTHEDQPAARGCICSALRAVFRYATSIQVLLRTTAGRRVLRHVAEEQRCIITDQCDSTAVARTEHDLELSFSWVDVQKLQEPTVKATSFRLQDTETVARLAHLWLFLASRASPASNVWSLWHVAVEAAGEEGTRVASHPEGSRLRNTLTDIIALIWWPNDKRQEKTRGLKRDRNTAESNVDNISVAQRVKHNLPLLGCLHSLIDAMIGSVHNLPDLHHEAAKLCAMLLDAFDGIMIDILHVKRRPGTVGSATEEDTRSGATSVDTSRVYVNCGVAILQLVYSICTFVNGVDEECCALVWRHQSELVRNRFERLGGVPSMSIFAMIAEQVTRCMFPLGTDRDPTAAGIQPLAPDARDSQKHGQLWRLFGEVVLQLRRWYTSRDKEEANVLSIERLESLLAEPARRLVYLQSCSHSNPSYELEKQAWRIGVVRELLLCLHEQYRTEPQHCDVFVASVLDALSHLVSQQCQREITALWEPVDADGAAAASHGRTCENPVKSAAAEVMIRCANLLRLQGQCMSRTQGGDPLSDRCCVGAVKVMLGLLRATAAISSDEIQHLSIGVMLAETGPTPEVTDVISSLIECAFGNRCVSLITSAQCARCLQYIVGLHDAFAANLLDSAIFSDKLLSQVVAKLEQATVHPGTNCDSSNRVRAENIANVWEDICELVSAVAGLLALCVERATISFWGRFGDDDRFFLLLRRMLDIVLLQTDLSNDANVLAPTTDVRKRAATHALRLVGNVADAVTCASKLNLAGVPQRLQHLADKGGEIGLSSEGCARVAQIARAVSS